MPMNFIRELEGENSMIPLAKQKLIRWRVHDNLMKVYDSGWWTMGKVTEALEKEFAEYIGVNYAIGVNSCSMALLFAIRAMDDKNSYRSVITTPLTFCSTVNALIHNGLYPLLVDVDKETQCMDLSNFIDQETVYYQGILPVHFAGYPCKMADIELLQHNHRVWVVQDCAHAVETMWNDVKVGSLGDVSCYSFNPIKNIAAPEMGMVVTNDKHIANKIRRWRLHGMDIDASKRVNNPGQYDILALGYKANPTDMEAVIALESLREVEDNWYRREKIWMHYLNAFHTFKAKGVFNGNLPIDCPIQFDDNKTVHGLHLFQIQLNCRDTFIEKMKKKGVFCGIHYKPVHLHTYYQKAYGWKRGDFPNAEWIGDHTCSLPLGPGMSNQDVEQVIKTIGEVLNEGNYLFE